MMWISGIIVAADLYDQHFRKKINMNVKEMNVNSTLNQQKLEGKQL